MKKLLFIFQVFYATLALAQQGTLTVEKIMQDPKWIGTSPSEIQWSYNSQSVYFKWNPEKAISDSIYIFHIGGKEPAKMKYEDAQTAIAIHGGTYDNAHTKIAYQYNNDIFLLSLANEKTTRITKTEGAKNLLGFSNHDQWVVYSSNDNLFAWDIADGTTRQLTDFIKKDAPQTANKSRQEQWLINAQLETSSVLKQRKDKRDKEDAYIKQSRDADTIKKIYIGNKDLGNLQISPDGKFITYTLSETPADAKSTIVPDYVTESGFTTDIPSRVKVGAPQTKSSFYIFSRVKDTVMKLMTDSLPGISTPPEFTKDYPQKNKNGKPSPRDVNIIELDWNTDGSLAIADIRSSDYKDRWLMQVEPATAKLTLIDHQHDEAWIAGPGIGWNDATFVGWASNHICYFHSEATGYSHLYTYDISSHTKKAITQGNFEIRETVISRDKKYFYYLSNEDHPGKQHLYRIRVDGTGKEKITSMDGGYEVSISPDEKYIAYRYSYQTKPWELYIQENAPGKKPIQVTSRGMSDEWKAYPWRDTKIFTITARDGKQVYSRIYEPAQGKKNNAAVIFVHGAGYLQNVDYRWSYYFREAMFNNLLADEGYTVLDIDYRASAGYGRDWRTGIYRYMGGKDLDDEVDAAKYLVGQYGIDPARIGMYGGSYGGFMALMALFTQPDVFKAGAALRPVTDWAHYDHGYTAAILNEPFTDSIAYQRSSPINFANGLKNHLLICHGMVDVNVHFEDAVRLTQRLIELGKNNWELAVYPVEDHGFVEPSSWTDEYKRVLKLFDTYLK